MDKKIKDKTISDLEKSFFKNKFLLQSKKYPKIEVSGKKYPNKIGI